MRPRLAKHLRNGGLSRRGFLRALGITSASVLVPWLVLTATKPVQPYRAYAVTINSKTGAWEIVHTYITHNGERKHVEYFTVDTSTSPNTFRVVKPGELSRAKLTGF